MGLKQLKSSLWHRYILYYCIIFTIPFIALSAYVFNTSLEKVESEFDNSIMTSLEQSKKIFIEQIEKLQIISTNISKDSYISPTMMEHEYYSSLGKDMILKYVESEPIVEDIVISYFTQNDKYYSSNGAYNSIEVLINEYYNGVNASKNTLRNIFKFKKPQIISLPTDEGENKFNLSYILPLYDKNGMQYGTTTFLLNEEKLSSILPEYDKKNKNEIYVINESNHVIFSNNHLNNGLIDNSGKLLNIEERNTYSADGENYRILTSGLEDLELEFINISNSNELVALLMSSAKVAIKLLAVVFLVGVALILGISYFQYLPIKKMYKELLNKREDYIYNKGEDELKNIENLIKDIITQNEELSSKNEVIYNVDENKLLLELIEGYSQDHEENEKSEFILELEARGKSYYIALIKKSQLSKEDKLMMHNILPIEEENYSAHIIQIPLQDKIGILVVHNTENISLVDSISDIQNRLCELESELYFYCGRENENLYKVNQSYIEAMIASDYIVDYSKQKYICYKESNSYEGISLKYPYDIEEKIGYGLKQGSFDVVNDSLEQVFEFIDVNKYRSSEIKIYSFYFINFIIKTASQVDYPSKKINIGELVEYNSLDQLKENIFNLVDDINKFVSAKREKVRDTFKENIFNDINKNYRSHDLSLEMLSQRYDYSVPYLSKMIKEETGMTFTKYIQELRFEYIKSQLVETTTPIKDIVYDAGYYDLSNFSRKFKTIMGITPGQYREINKDNVSLESI